MKYNINRTAESPLCRMCGTRNETISHMVSECGKLALKKFNRARVWHEHEPESVVGKRKFKNSMGLHHTV